MQNLKDLSVQIAKRYNKENDIPFVKYVQDLILQARGTLMQQYLNKNVDLPYHYYTTIDSVELISLPVSKNTISSGNSKKQRIMKLELPKIYTVVNNQRQRLAIKYLGNINMTEAYTYTTPSRIEAINKGDRFTDITNYYSIINNKVNTYNKSRKFFTIVAAFINPFEVAQFGQSTNYTCFGGFEITYDEANKIKSFVLNELDSDNSKDKEIQLNG